jgi:UDP-2-acetamido-3-amino-2,3-dideoxy-glucuronate N-acetyltransferase
MRKDDPMLHPKAIVEEGAVLGTGTRVWAFAHILKGAVVGSDCNICDHTFIEGGVRLGDRVTIKSGVHLWDGLIAEDDVFIGPSAAFANDRWPRSKQRPSEFAKVLLRSGASLGANCTILPVSVGRWAMIGAGSVVTRDVPDHALVIGNPGRIAGWVCRCAKKLVFGNGTIAECICGQKFTHDGKFSVQTTL